MSKTTDYKIFRNIEGNRAILPGHAEKLAEAIDRKNLLKYFPVLVNEKMEVIDGQHRLMAAAKLNVPAYYEVVNGLRLDDVMSINTHSRGWSIEDFIDTYIQLGKTSYAELRRFMQRHHMSANVSAQLLYGYNNTGKASRGNSIAQVIKDGAFTVNTPDQAERMATQLTELARLADYRCLGDKALTRCLFMLDRNEDFDFDRLVAKMRLGGLRLQQRATVPQMLLQIEELYNFNAKAKVELYASSQQA